jgi:hypothetical protein
MSAVPWKSLRDMDLHCYTRHLHCFVSWGGVSELELEQEHEPFCDVTREPAEPTLTSNQLPCDNVQCMNTMVGG